MSGLKVSEEHGLNPTIPVCFWCGKDKGEVVLLGKLKGDREAPMKSILDIQPCPECRKKWDEAIDKGGVLMFEYTEQPYEYYKDLGEDRVRSLINLHREAGIANDHYPNAVFTGRMLAVKEEAFDKMFDLDEEELKRAHRLHKMFIDKKVFDTIAIKE